ncbi:MAG: class I SAM-dependent methyltransferase [Myxococcota bacterium]
MGLRGWLKPHIQDWAMASVAKLRPSAVESASGDVLEIGFGTGLNLEHYGPEVQSLHGIDPMVTEGVAKVDARIEKATFPVKRVALRGDGVLPFDSNQFDSVVTTWTLCSIPDANAALREMLRVLKPRGRYYFIEHGRSREPRVMQLQDRINPTWRRFADGCNINRQIDEVVEAGGFELASMEEFLGKGPKFVSTFYRGVGVKN